MKCSPSVLLSHLARVPLPSFNSRLRDWVLHSALPTPWVILTVLSRSYRERARPISSASDVAPERSLEEKKADWARNDEISVGDLIR